MPNNRESENLISSTGRKKSSVIATLQAGRGIAALLLVFYHNGGSIFAKEKYWGHDPLNKLFEFGSAGVMFFFVLSGFIIFHVHWNDLGNKQRFVSYVKKRFVRIYPIYWLVLLPLAVIYFFVPSFGSGHERDFWTILSSVLLVHINSGYTVVGVAWTLYHEIVFYLFFALAIFNKRLGIIAMGVWFAATALYFLGAPPCDPDEFNTSAFAFYLSPLHLLFGMGMGLCWFVHHEKIRMPAVLAVFGSLAFLFLGLDEDYSGLIDVNARKLLYGLACAFALAGFIELERQGRIVVPKILGLMGDASYSIYLIHLPVLSVLAKVFCSSFLKEYVPVYVAYILLPFFAVLAGIAVHLGIEKPVLNKMGRIMGIRKK